MFTERRASLFVFPRTELSERSASLKQHRRLEDLLMLGLQLKLGTFL